LLTDLLKLVLVALQVLQQLAVLIY
jgi:hypothetical protein